MDNWTVTPSNRAPFGPKVSSLSSVSSALAPFSPLRSLLSSLGRAVPVKRATRHVVYDTNFWKSFMHARLATAMGDPGSLSLYGHRAETHRMLAEHLTAEYRVETSGRGRTVDEWNLRADNLDNHLLDGVVGSMVAASMCGVKLGGVGVAAAPKKRRRVSLSEMQREARARRDRR